MSVADRIASEQPPAALPGQLDLTSEGGEFTDIRSEEPITDWSDVFRRFNLDPESFTIVDDTVRMSVWEQSKRLENGDRDTVQMHSYRARFTRRAAGMVDVPALTESLRKWKPTIKPVPRQLGTPVTYFDGWADWQIGKGEGDGTPGTIQRILDGFEKSQQRIKQMREAGINVSSLLVANMGDPTEAVTGHYASQTYSVDLNLRDQINTALELSLTGLKALAPMFDEVTYTACLCNHGQWQRVGGKALTDDADNSTGLIGDVLAQTCALHPNLSHIKFDIPRDEMITTGTFSGVGVAMAHGHKISGAEDAWLAKQTGWLRTTKDFKVELWATAHRHTASVDDMGTYHRIQCTTNDPGSKSFTDATGKFSTQGTTTFLIGRHDKRLFSHYEVL
jgi:hypothetical protein